MSRDDHQNTLLILNEIKRLVKMYPDLVERLDKILGIVDFKQSIDGNLYSPDLYEIIVPSTNYKELFEGIPSNSIPVLLMQYLLIHYYLSKNCANPQKLTELESFVNECSQLNEIIGGWQGYARVVIYQDYFNKCSWEAYLETCTWDWTEINMLDCSILNCYVTFDSVCRYLISIRLEHPNDIAVPGLGKNLIEKIRIDEGLKAKIGENLEKIISDPHLSSFFPSFMCGLITSVDEFKKWFTITSEMFKTDTAFTILYALVVACPDNQSCVAILREKIKEALSKSIISQGQSIRLYSVRDYEANEIFKEVHKLSAETDETEVVLAMLDFVANNLKSEVNRATTYDILRNIVKHPDEKCVSGINHLIYQLIKTDITFTYELIGKRFEILGSAGFLNDCWHKLVSTDRELFSVNLTRWLNSDNPNVHRALQRLCNASGILPSDFRISKEVLSKLQLRDKLYIAVKIIGYIYSKDHLQALMFSFVESTQKEEDELINNLYGLFDQYVIYNYRTTLDTIKEILEKKELPDHILKFFDQLNRSYEEYFERLRLVENFSELQPDSILVQHLQFYTQNLFMKQSKEVRKTGLMSLFKNTPVHSHRWAIRREGETIHTPQTLGKFSTSMEFPSGEKLSPIYQETMRRRYQNLKRNEIDLN